MSAGAKSTRTEGYELPAIFANNATNQTITVNATSAQSAAFQSSTTVIRIYCEHDFYLDVGDNPTADDTKIFCPGTIVHFFGVNPGSKAAVIRATNNNGTAHIMEGGY